MFIILVVIIAYISSESYKSCVNVSSKYSCFPIMFIYMYYALQYQALCVLAYTPMVYTSTALYSSRSVNMPILLHNNACSQHTILIHINHYWRTPIFFVCGYESLFIKSVNLKCIRVCSSTLSHTMLRFYIWPHCVRYCVILPVDESMTLYY